MAEKTGNNKPPRPKTLIFRDKPKTGETVKSDKPDATIVEAPKPTKDGK
jgi:hypothetical protein